MKLRCYVKKKKGNHLMSYTKAVVMLDGPIQAKPRIHIRSDTGRGVGGAGGGGAGAKTKGLDHRLGRAVDNALALAALEEVAVVLQGRVEVTAAGDKLVELERLVLHRLVNDRSLVDLLVNRDGGLDAVVLVHVTLNDVLDNVLALVDNDTLTLALGELVAGGVERGELGLVVGGRNVLLLDLGGGDNLLLDVLGAVLGVEDRLDVVLDVVDVTVDFTLALNLLDLVDLVPLVSDRGKVLVVVSGSLGVGDVEEAVLARVLVLVVRREGRLLEVSPLASEAVVRTLGAVSTVGSVSSVGAVGAVRLVGRVSASRRGRAGGGGGREASVGARGSLVDRVGGGSRRSARSRGLDNVTGGAVTSRRARRRSGGRTGGRVTGRRVAGRRVAVAGRGGVGGLVRVRENLLDLVHCYCSFEGF